MSAFNVAKFGGTSVANFDAMSRCATIIENNPTTKLVVSSACSGVTNLLVELALGVQNPNDRDAIFTELKPFIIPSLNTFLISKNQTSG